MSMDKYEVTDAELDNSLVILKQTISNLKEKKQFLVEQRLLYVDLRSDLLDYVESAQEGSTSSSSSSSEKTMNGKIIGEIIVSSDKIFKNIGYEYYVQISKDECVEFIESKILMIEKAIAQFELKLKECDDVLSDFEAFNMYSMNEALEESLSKKQTVEETNITEIDSSDNGDSSVDTDFPVMDIREELDEEGNVLSSSVKPVDSKLSDAVLSTQENAKLDTKLTRDKDTNIRDNTNIAKSGKRESKSVKTTNSNQVGIMEIREELDEEGNVVSSNVYSHKETVDKQSQKNSGVNKQEKQQSVKKEQFVGNDLKNTDLQDNEEFYDLLEDMGIIDDKMQYLTEKYASVEESESVSNIQSSVHTEQHQEEEPKIIELCDVEEENSDIIIKDDIEEKEEKEEEEEEEEEDDDDDERAVLDVVENVIKEVDLADVKVLGRASSNKEYLKYTDPSKPAIDPKDLYTLEEIIQKLDINELGSDVDEYQEDEEEEMGHDEHDTNSLGQLDYERFEKYFYDQDDNDTDEDDDEDEEYEYEEFNGTHSGFGFSMVPGQAASSAFEQRILELRKQKLEHSTDQLSQNESHAEALEETKISEFSPKSILKDSQSKVPNPSKKSVGFAKSLDIVVVENMKDETKKNTFGFANYYNMYNNDDDEEEDEEEEEYNYLTDGLDRNSSYMDYNPIQETIQETTPSMGVESIVSQSEDSTTEISDSKPKVSKFKQNRLQKKGNPKRNSILLESFDVNASVVTDIISESTDTSMLDNILAHVSEPTTSDIVENIPDAISLDIVERDVSEIIVESAVLNNSPKPESTDETKLFGKQFKSLQKPVRKPQKEVELNFSSDDENDEQITELGNEPESESESESDLEKPLDIEVLETETSMKIKNFPEDLTKAMQEKKDIEIISNPKIDYAQLTDMDELAKAYMMGLYDDDIERVNASEFDPAKNDHEGPGYVVEKIEDFEGYNKTVELLKDEINEFLLERNNNDEIDEDENTQLYREREFGNDGGIMTDIFERDNGGDDFDYENDDTPFELQDHVLQEQISKEYYSMRQKIISNQRSFNHIDTDDKEKEFEPIDQHGNPVKTSRFKSSRINIKSTNF